MSKRSLKNKELISQQILKVLTPADTLLTKRVSDAAAQLQKESGSLTGNPVEHIRRVFMEMPDWVLYRLVQANGWAGDHRVLVYLLVHMALSDAQVLPKFNEEVTSTIASMLMLVSVELLASRQNKPMPEDFAEDLLAGDGAAADLVRFYSQSDPRLREPSEFELLYQLPQTKGLARILATR